MITQAGGILLIVNDFSSYEHRCGNWALMPHLAPPFAAFKPAFGGQKNKDKDQRAERVPLPGIPFVSPKENLLDRVHLNDLPTSQP